ncbi:hypothetical protein [Aliarcobacter butzleri]|uniref:hypothetical protein n=1 Tax=Aliarcobacter butzleri TaxID=28197 RepID=UPI002B2518A4|nr:hypothetical protein [Aliarcobacter butzleri]
MISNNKIDFLLEERKIIFKSFFLIIIKIILSILIMYYFEIGVYIVIAYIIFHLENIYSSFSLTSLRTNYNFDYYTNDIDKLKEEIEILNKKIEQLEQES